MEQDDIDNYKYDPCFEPKAKKQKTDEELISNELMHYIINKFGRDFFSENDKKERKLMAEVISEDLLNEKSVAINHETIYNNLMEKKRTFLTVKKRLSKGATHVSWQFFEPLSSLGDCIQKEAKEKTTKDKRNKKSSKKSLMENPVDVSLNQSVGLERLFEENAPKNDVIKENIENVNASSHENDVLAENQNNLNSINIPGTSSTAIPSETASSTSYKEEKEEDNAKPTRSVYNLPRGYFFDSSIDIRDKMKLFFGPSDSNDTNSHKSKEEGTTSEAPKSEETKEQDTAMKSQEENVFDSAINAKTDGIVKEQEKSSDKPIMTRDIINSEVNSTAEIQEDSHNKSDSEDESNTSNMHANLNSVSVSYLEMVIGIVNDKEDDKEEQEKSDEVIVKNDDYSVASGSGIQMEINNENNGQKEMAPVDIKTPHDDNNNEKVENVTKNVDKESPKGDPIKEVENANETVDISEQLNQLSDIMENHESLIAKLMSIEDQRVQLQFDILESDMKYKATLVEIFKKFNKS